MNQWYSHSKRHFVSTKAQKHKASQSIFTILSDSLELWWFGGKSSQGTKFSSINPILSFFIISGLISVWASHTLIAQAFQPTQIRDIAKMSNNYGNAVADYDQDGDLDIFIVAYESFRPDLPQTWSRLLKNNGSGWFEDVTVEAGFGQQYVSSTVPDHKIGAAWGDYDNDGFPDLFLTHSGHTQLYHNNQNGTFSDVSVEAKITACTYCVNTSALWWDYDNDSDLDLYISDYQFPNRLFNNQGDGTFINATLSTKLGDSGDTWCSIPIDANRDGWMDLYVVNDYGLSRFYLNHNGHYFEEATSEFGLINSGNGMGATIGDYNNDGNFDIYITNIAEFQANALFTGSDSGVFQDQNAAQQVGNGHWGWGTHFFDADHDGDEDLYLVNGFGNLFYPNKFFKNMAAEGSAQFIDWTVNSFADGQGQGMAMEVFDYDEDGDLDILVSNTNEAPYLYKNTGRAPGSNWLQIELEGTLSNHNAFGTIVKASAQGKSFYRFHQGANIMAQSIKPLHFGLGNLKTVDSLSIIWPNSEPETFLNIDANQKIKVIEHDTLILPPKEVEKPNTEVPLSDLSLTKLHPNPFYETVSIEVATNQTGRLYCQIYALTGGQVMQLEKDITEPGSLQLEWSGTNGAGKKLASGMYLYYIRLNDAFLSGKIILSDGNN